MKVKTATLTGAVLDYAVALAEQMLEGADAAQFIHARRKGSYLYTTGAAGDAIIDREKIETRWRITDPEGGGHWTAANLLTDTYGCHGPDRRTAAMRCWVIHKLGPEVEIPCELEGK